MSRAKSFINSLQNEKVGNAVSFILKREQKRDIKGDDFEELKSHIEDINHESINKVEKLKRSVRTRLNLYVVPSQSVLGCVSAYEASRVVSNRENANLDDLAQLAAAETGNPNTPRLQRRHTVIPDLIKPFEVIGQTYFAIRFDDGTSTELDKLIHPEPMNFSDMADKVVELSGSTGQVNICETLIKIMDFCEKRGYDLDALAETFKGFVMIHLPHISANLYLRTKAYQILDLILDSVNYATMANDIKLAIRRLNRPLGENIRVVLGKYQGLLYEAARLDAPDKDQDELHRRSVKETIKNAKSFVVPALANEVEELRKTLKIEHDDDLDFDRLCKFIEQEELSEPFRPRNSISLSGSYIAMSIFNTAPILAREAESASQFSDINALSHSPPNGKEKIYPYNMRTYRPEPERYTDPPTRGRPYIKSRPKLPTPTSTPLPSPSAPPQSAESSRPPTPADSVIRSRTPSPFPSPRPSRSPTPTGRTGSPRPFSVRSRTQSPSPGRQRNSSLYYRSPSGNIRKLSQTRVMTRSPHGTLRNRNISSRNPSTASPQSTFRCRLCASSKHRTPSAANGLSCKVYPNQLPTAVPCPRCRLNLYHSADRCQHSNSPSKPKNL